MMMLQTVRTAGAVAIFATLYGSVALAAEAGPPQSARSAPSSEGHEGLGPPALVAPASVQAFFATELYAKDSGYISQVYADIGDHVKKDQVLAVIDDPELQQQFVRARAAVQQSEAALLVANRRLVGLQADLTLQQVTLKRWEELFAGKAVTGQQLDEQRAKQGVSSANLEVGRADIALAEANLEAAKAELQRLQALVEYTKIIAPFDGIITRRMVNPGDLVQAATSSRPMSPLFTCQEIDTVRVFAEVPETSAAAIHAGWLAEIRLYGPAGQTLRGSVTRVAGALDPGSRTMRVEIDLPNPDEALMPGMYAQVTLWAPPKATEANAVTPTVRQ
jgi:multidrug efflux pump subunit AcrA (membrane-fusion protein)